MRETSHLLFSFGVILEESLGSGLSIINMDTGTILHWMNRRSFASGCSTRGTHDSDDREVQQLPEYEPEVTESVRCHNPKKRQDFAFLAYSGSSWNFGYVRVS